MFDMGFLELLLIGIIALIVLGPERLPRAARTVGLWIGKAKQGFESIKTEIDRELKVKELQQQLAEQKAKLEADLSVESEFSSLKDDLNQTANSINQGMSSLGQAFDESAEGSGTEDSAAEISHSENKSSNTEPAKTSSSKSK